MEEVAFQELVAKELQRAREKFPPIHSRHEAYAVMREELEEFWELCRKWKGEPAIGDRKLLRELVQIAAMAQRSAEDLGVVG
jgi:hypothetical protein